jgi:lipopolysaccharide/colanic/teichoic acid biosynthesis glycosyltransferase
MTTLVTVPRRSTPSPTAKRTLDLVMTSFMMVVALPLMGAIAVAIRLESPGPILFRQQRTGRDGRRFAMLKFRTMVENAEELKSELAHLNVLPPPDFKILNDPRTTRVGHLLRETSLDELPQLFNVLRGQMSLVGPRPTSLGVDQYDLWHSTRLEVAPGLTGLWQVHGRNTTSFDERLRLDIAYIDQRSVWMDLRILARTFLVVLLRTGK